jgi:hypothetical protein
MRSLARSREEIFDGSGLYLEVSPRGSRWWRIKYRIDGVEKQVSPGVYPDITLKRAAGDVPRPLANRPSPLMRKTSPHI